jgi:hypothetical protein
MPVKRKKPKFRRGELPDFVVWWLEHGRYLNSDECCEVGFENPERAVWGLFTLNNGTEPPHVAPHVWTRQKLRAAGYDTEIDIIEARERAERDEEPEPTDARQA